MVTSQDFRFREVCSSNETRFCKTYKLFGAIIGRFGSSRRHGWSLESSVVNLGCIFQAFWIFVSIFDNLGIRFGLVSSVGSPLDPQIRYWNV